MGTVLRGKYHLDRVLGVGGMAAVYAATHRNQKQFAIKVLKTELSSREDVRARFLREGYAANSLKHAGAVSVLDDDVAEDGSAFLVMELLEGAGVEVSWERLGERLPLRAALALCHQLLDVLAAAHARGIVHRDIKPANLFLLHDGTLKVLDFGIARVRDVAVTSVQTTGTGMLLGTPAFLSPEQAMAKSADIDGRTDLWAVGATLFTLLSGKLVHQADNPLQLVVVAATQPARSLASVIEGVPPAVVDIVDRATAFERDARWATAREMREAIRAAHERIFVQPVSPAPLAALFPALGVGEAHGAARQETRRDPALDVAATVSSVDAQLKPPTRPGVTTAVPMSTDAARVAIPGGRSRRRWPLFLSAGGVAVVGVTVAAVKLAHAPPPPPASSATEAEVPRTSARANAAASPATPPEPLPASPAAPSADSATTPVSSPPAVQPSAPSSPVRPSTPAREPARRPCTKVTVSYLDSEGNTRFKQVCQ